MDDILDRAAYLCSLDSRYRHFAEHLEMLAKSFQSKALLRFVESHIEKQIRV
jgi:hypothetical protein